VSAGGFGAGKSLNVFRQDRGAPPCWISKSDAIAQRGICGDAGIAVSRSAALHPHHQVAKSCGLPGGGIGQFPAMPRSSLHPFSMVLRVPLLAGSSKYSRSAASPGWRPANKVRDLQSPRTRGPMSRMRQSWDAARKARQGCGTAWWVNLVIAPTMPQPVPVVEIRNDAVRFGHPKGPISLPASLR